MSATITPTTTVTALESLGVVLDNFSRTKTRELRTIDRCDRCNAAAANVRAVKDGTELIFCTHHAKKNVPALVSQGWLIDDQS